MSAPDADRCPYVNTHWRLTRPQMRDDGWRCAEKVRHAGGHVLMTSDGERLLDSLGPWEMGMPTFAVEEVLPVEPEPVGVIDFSVEGRAFVARGKEGQHPIRLYAMSDGTVRWTK